MKARKALTSKEIVELVSEELLPSNLPLEQAHVAFVANHLRPLREQSGLNALSKEIGISKPQVSDILKLKGGVGPKVERMVADRFYGGSLDAYHAAVHTWINKQSAAAPESTRHAVEDTAFDPRFEDLYRLLKKRANKNRWPEAAVVAAKTVQLGRDETPDEAWWERQLESFERAIAIATLTRPPPPSGPNKKK